MKINGHDIADFIHNGQSASKAIYNGSIVWQKESSSRYLTFSAPSGTQTIKFEPWFDEEGQTFNFEYSLDNKEWTTWADIEKAITFGGDTKLYLRAGNEGNEYISIDSSNYCYIKFGSSTPVYIEGDITALLDSKKSVTSIPDYCFYMLFRFCKQLMSAPEIPNVASVGSNAYGHLYYYCSNLSSVTCRSTTDILDKCYKWLSNAASSGTLYVPDKTVWGTTNIPSGWTIENIQ